jgi:tetratricopeptide (TPR) repeat protein
MSNAATSQLADTAIDTPLRIKATGNVPVRNIRKGIDEEARINTYSPNAYVKMKASVKAALSNDDNSTEVLRKILSVTKTSPPAMNADDDAGANTAIKDFSILALSSKRAGKKEVEAQAYLSLGMIYDNQNKLKKAIENYKLYLALCEDMGDLAGQAVAANFIGVNYLYLSASGVQGMLHAVSEEDPIATNYIQAAMVYHEKHLRVADSGGQFVALTNLGLGYGMLRNIIESAKCHQDALRAAIKMQSIHGQVIAVGNLGLLAMFKADYATARTCFEQHLNLVQALQDKEAEVNAWKMLADLSAMEDNADVIDNLQQARRVAAKEGYTSELRKVHCLLGRAHGLVDFFDFALSTSAMLQIVDSEDMI